MLRAASDHVVLVVTVPLVLDDDVITRLRGLVTVLLRGSALARFVDHGVLARSTACDGTEAVRWVEVQVTPGAPGTADEALALELEHALRSDYAALGASLRDLKVYASRRSGSPQGTATSRPDGPDG